MKKIYLTLALACFSLASYSQCAKGTIVISEIYFDSHYSEDINTKYHHFGEYIELYNSSSQAINLNGWTIKDNHTEFKILTNGQNPNTIIQPGAHKVIIFGGFHAYGLITRGGYIDTGAESAIGAKEKFIELFPQATGHEDDILVQRKMVLYNRADKVSLYNPSEKLIHELSYKNGGGNSPSILSYMKIDAFDIELTYLNNKTGGIFNGAIGTVPLLNEEGEVVTNPNGTPIMIQRTDYMSSLYLSAEGNYYYNGGKNIQVGIATPFSLPFAIAQEPVFPGIFSPPSDHHWIHLASYDVKDKILEEVRNYYDSFAKQTVSLSWNSRTDHTFGTETTYDMFGRASKKSYPALSCVGFEHIPFLTNSGFYVNNLKWYYSNQNTEEPYQPTATDPYIQTNYDKLDPDKVLSIIGGNKINNEWKAAYTYTVPAAQEVYYLYGKDYFDGPASDADPLLEEVIAKYYKTVYVDVNGVENVIFLNSEGKTLASARSGGTQSIPVVSLINTQGYIDVHIPNGISSSQINLLGGASGYTVYNLKTGAIDTAPLTGGNAYRIVANTYPVDDPKVYINATGGITYTPLAKGVEYKVNYYDFTLNCYNVTGQLMKVIQPKGLQIPSTIVAAPSYMNATSFAVTQKFDSQGKLKEVTSPDEGTSRFLYCNDGKIRYSQNTLQQSAPSRIAYNEYDTIGRLIESGVVATTANFIELDPDAPLVSGNRSEQVFTIYDYPENIIVGQPVPTDLASLVATYGLPAAEYKPRNLSGSIAVSYSKPGASITTSTWYSYDIYGHVEWLVQYIEGLGLKTIHYGYDHKGNINKIIYQKHKLDEMFVHRYTYDDANFVVKVETSLDNIAFTVQTENRYMLTGEMKRKIYAGGIQGTDYVYTLGGMLKSVNHPSLKPADDPGHDSNDLFGFTLDYYSGDYIREGTNIETSASVPNYNVDSYAGMIKAQRFGNKLLDGSGNSTSKAYLYKYNRNNWLTDATWGTVNINTVTPAPNGKYSEGNMTYDANGNILTLQRRDEAGVMYDNLNYTYNSGKNQLQRVADPVSDNAKSFDIDGQASNNYNYNSIGQLIKDVKENLYYLYNELGYVTEVKRGEQPLIRFYYNEKGHRIKKEFFSTMSPFSLASTEYYVTDALGTVFAIYSKPMGQSLTLKEHPMYDEGRLGIYYRQGGPKYEIKDHVGNTRAIFKKEGSGAVMQYFADYYPFGEQIPQRNSLDGQYRYSFQGQEKDLSTGMETFQLRLWDGRIGRWLSPDPKQEFTSPYLGMGNNPVILADADGGSTTSTGVKKNRDGTYTVVGARDDGNSGIYLVDKFNNWNVNTSKSIGFSTLHPWTFMIPNDKTGKFDKGFAEVTFDVKKLANGNAIFEKYTDAWRSILTGRNPIVLSKPGLTLLAVLSRNNGPLDIKTLYPQSSGGFYTPVLINKNTIGTVREMGNLVFGANMRTVYDKAWNTIFTSPMEFYRRYMPVVGFYNQYQNGGNGYNKGFPYYGEHTYSGINTYIGFFGQRP